MVSGYFLRFRIIILSHHQLNHEPDTIHFDRQFSRLSSLLTSPHIIIQPPPFLPIVTFLLVSLFLLSFPYSHVFLQSSHHSLQHSNPPSSLTLLSSLVFDIILQPTLSRPFPTLGIFVCLGPIGSWMRAMRRISVFFFLIVVGVADRRSFIEWRNVSDGLIVRRVHTEE